MDTKELIDVVGKAVLALAATAYAAGLLIANIDLADYGIASFSLNRPQYILVGAAWIILSGMTAIPGLMALAFGFHISRLWSMRPLALMALTIATATFLLQQLLTDIRADPVSLGNSLFQILGIELVIFIFAVNYRRDASDPTDGLLIEVKSERYKSRLLIRAILCVFLIIPFWLPVYATTIFPHIKPQYGGGSHPRAVVSLRLPEPTSAAQIASIVGPIKVQNLTTEIVRVLLVDGDYVAITSGRSSPTILINKSIVGAIRYQ